MNNNCNVQVRGYKYSTKKDRIWFFSLQHLDMLLHILKEPLKSFSGSLVFKALHDSYSYIRAKAVVKYHQGPRKAPNPFSSSTEKLQEKFHGQECWEQCSLFGAPGLEQGQVPVWGDSPRAQQLRAPPVPAWDCDGGRHNLHYSLHSTAVWKSAIKSIKPRMPSIFLELAGLGLLQMCCCGGRHPSESAQLRQRQPPHHSVLTYSLPLQCH